MTRDEWFALWAPEQGAWSAWARPVLFAQLDPATLTAEPLPLTTESDVLPAADRRTAIILDIPGREAVRLGVRLAASGYQPVPLFNGTDGPSPMCDVRSIGAELVEGARTLAQIDIAADAPPAFLLDSERKRGTPAPGRFDNRWVVLPQDFPSANMLRSRGLERAIVVQNGSAQPQPDLAHVLRRWQDAGLRILALDLAAGYSPSEITVEKPARFRTLWWGIIALLGLRRSNVGGFGGVVPEQTTGGGYS